VTTAIIGVSTLYFVRSNSEDTPPKSRIVVVTMTCQNISTILDEDDLTFLLLANLFTLSFSIYFLVRNRGAHYFIRTNKQSKSAMALYSKVEYWDQRYEQSR